MSAATPQAKPRWTDLFGIDPTYPLWDVEGTPQATANLLLEVAVQWAAELIRQGRTASARRRLADGLEAARFVLGEGL